MQNINSGFTSLKRLLPPTEKKQTKAAILEQAVQHILRLQRTVVQVRETNNTLRQNLADERKQRLDLKKELDVQIGERFQGAPFFSHIKLKGRAVSPPHAHQGHRARVFNHRWPTASCSGGVSVSSSGNQIFDRFSLHESTKLSQVPVILKTQELWEGNNKNETCSPQEEPSTLYQQASGISPPRDILPEPGACQRSSLGNNLQCIVDAINLLEKS